MSLVAYDSSDESEEEKPIKNIPAAQKKSKEAVKIRIPSLKEFEDDEEIPVAKKPKLQSGSGLFSLLPPPKNTSTCSKSGFMPYILTSKKKQPPSKEIQKCTDTKISTPSAVLENQESDDENDKSSVDSVNVSKPSDFFWLDDLISNTENKGNESNVIPSESSNIFKSLPSHFSPTSNDVQLNVSKEATNFQQSSETNASQTEKYFENSSSVDQSYSSGNSFTAESTDELDAEALLKSKEFLKLQGRRREFENIDIIDVSGDDQLTDKKQWLIKGLTEESAPRPSRKKHNMPTQQQKRKHQITYLAFQAKERENDLKNQWALNSRTRRETQAKYGF